MPYRTVGRFVTRWRGTAVATLVPIAAVIAVAVIQDQQADDTAAAIREGQVAACERGNVLRLQMAEDNAIAIQAARTQIAGGHLSAAELEALEASVTRRVARADDLAPYPCHTLR